MSPAESRILVGTASWTDKSLTGCGRFYPPAVKTAEGRLRYYATHFPVVEIDSSFYALPSARNAQLWAERGPEGFSFDIKAFRIFTQHWTEPAFLPKDIREALGPTAERLYYRDLPPELAEELWKRFREAVEPLAAAGKLGAVLLQFPPWFVFRRPNLDHILLCAAKLTGLRVAVEFRNKSWFGERWRDRVLAFEREHGLVHVIVDEPQGSASSVPPVWEVTSPDLAIVRLHGRNRAAWERKGLASSAERFNYLYSEAELDELAAPVRELATQARRVHVLFNNCHEDKAQRNALQFSRFLDQPER